MIEGKVIDYVHHDVKVLGYWNRYLGDNEVATTHGACEDNNSALSRAFDLWVRGKDEDVKALIPEKDHILLEGLIIWGGVIRETDPPTRVSATVKIEDKP